MANSGGKPRFRKVKKAKRPPPLWVRKTLKFFNIGIKLSIVVLIFYLFWLIYVEVYEAWLYAYLPMSNLFV